MSAIEGATVKVGTLVDGTLRVTIDFHPTVRNEAFALFGGPGTPVAVAALRAGHAMASDEPVAAPEPKGGPLSQWLAQRCNEAVFRAWVARVITDTETLTPEQASAVVCKEIGVRRKREIDGDRYAPARLKVLIMHPYSDMLKTRGAA